MPRGGRFEVEHGGNRRWSSRSSLDRADVSVQREGRRQEEAEALRRLRPRSPPLPLLGLCPRMARRVGIDAHS